MLKPGALLFFAAFSGLARGGEYKALDRYIAAPDPSFRYSLSRPVRFPGFTPYELDVVLVISTVPRYIDGGSDQNSPGDPDPTMTALAAQSGTMVVDLGQVPSEPLLFADQTHRDALVAYTKLCVRCRQPFYLS